MSINMTLLVTGAIPVDFEMYDYVKVFCLANAKSGSGSVSEYFKYGKSENIKEFEHLEFGKLYPADCTGHFESSGKGSEFVIDTIRFKGQVKP